MTQKIATNFRFRTTQTAIEFPKDYEQPRGKSLTVPDQSMTVLEIMQRHAQGLSITDGRVPIWEGEEDETPDTRRMDISEIHDMMQSNKENMEQIRKKLNTKPPKKVIQPELPIPGQQLAAEPEQKKLPE